MRAARHLKRKPAAAIAIAIMAFAAGCLALVRPGAAAEPSPAPAAISITATTNAPAKPLPTGEQLIQRMLSRSTELAADTNQPVWTYDKLQVMLKLADDGKVQERTEKFYRVEIVQGVPFSRVVRVDGHDLTAAESKKENEREAEFQKGLSGRDPKKAVAGQEALLTTNIADLFEFKAVRREPVHGRPTIVVNFAAKPGKGDNSMTDRLLRGLTGTVWVDEQTADVARLDLHLTKAVSLGVLGMLGSIKEIHMAMESTPMPDGTWLPEKTEMSFAARILISGIRIKLEETSTNFLAKPTPEFTTP